MPPSRSSASSSALALRRKAPALEAASRPAKRSKTASSAPAPEPAEPALPVASSSTVRKPVEITFDPSQYMGTKKASKAEKKAFMSSKASKILADPHAIPEATSEEASEEKMNLSLDKTLHSMLQPLLASDGKQTAHSLQGRLTELAGDSRLGKGEKAVRKSFVSTLGGSRVGTGMRKVGAERYAREVATARERGETEQMTAALSTSLYADDHGKKKHGGKGRKETDRGLKMGVGSFGGGTLRLSAGDMEGVKREVDRKKRGAERFQREHGGGRGGRGGARGGGRGGRGGGRGGSSSRGRGK